MKGLKNGSFATVIIEDDKFSEKQGIVLRTKKDGTIVVGFPLKGKIITRSIFRREHLRFDEEPNLLSRVNMLFKDYKKIIPFNGQFNGCHHESCKLFATATVIVKRNQDVLEIPVCSKHTCCDGKNFSNTRLRAPEN